MSNQTPDFYRDLSAVKNGQRQYDTQTYDLDKISDEELAKRMIKHVADRGGPAFKNGVWDMMQEAARRLLQREESHEQE